jgi:hypothetical protein
MIMIRMMIGIIQSGNDDPDELVLVLFAGAVSEFVK